MLIYLNWFVSFVSLVLATSLCAKGELSVATITMTLKVGFVFATISTLLIQMGSGLFIKKLKLSPVCLKNMMIVFAIFLITPTVITHNLNFSIMFLTMAFNIFFNTMICKNLSEKIPQVLTEKVIAIGNRTFIESIILMPQLQTVGAICFDDYAQCIGGYVPNLGDLDDLPHLLKRIQNIPNLTLIAEDFIAKKIEPFVHCPIIGITKDNLAHYQTA